ncbi:MAG: PAS domain-containing sensor histidine kinase [Dehalogenimonas sp.]
MPEKKDVRDDQVPKESEQEYKPIDTNYRRLFETSQDGLLIIDAETGMVLEINSILEKILGCPRQEVLNKAIWDLGFLKSVFADKAKLAEFQQQQYVRYDDLPLEGSDGRKIDIELISNAYNIENQRIIRLNIRNISGRKQAEQALSAISRHQDTILSTIPDIIMEVDNNKIYTWANRAGTEFFGEDVVGKEASFYFEGEQDTYGYVQPIFNGSIAETVYIESWQRRKDGQRRLLAWWCRSLKDESGNVVGALSAARDITERQIYENKLLEAEQRLTSANEHLEQQVEERTRSLRAQVETTKRAESELRALSARIITTQEEERRAIARELHDEIGQALTALTLMLSRLKNSIPQESNPQIEVINRELSGVMGRVRLMSKTLRPTVLDDLGLVPGLEWLFSRLKEQTGFQTDFDCPEIKILEPNTCITAYRIIQESLTNVMRHSGVNSAVVKITKDDNYLRLRVTDYGRGFNPLEVPTSTGLSAMKERAKLVGGTVDMESTPGKGTVVTAQIPYK